jgi:peptide/nickel transport system substrate-binding protein
MNKNRTYVLLALVLALSMILAACAQPTAAPATEAPAQQPAAQEPTQETMAEPTQEPMAEPTQETMAEPTSAPAETAKKTFIFGRGGDSVSLDLSTVTDGESTRVAGQITESLYTFAPGTTNPVPNLAEECTPNDAGTEWTCTLKQGVQFHDGTDFNADAVIFNFNRWKNTTDPYHFPDQVFEYYEAMWGGFDDASIITSVDKVDDYTVKFTLSAPLAPFLANLGMDFFGISSPAAIEKYGQDYGTPSVGAVGTGPFVFKEWVEGDHITVTANDNYWGGRPKVDEVIWRVIADDSARYLALKAGDIQGLEQATVEDLTDAANNPDLYIMKKPPLNTAYLAFNYKIKEFQDPKVREAIAHAINKQAIQENFYGTTGVVAKTLVPPSMWGYNDAIQDWEYNPDLSKQLLTEAGFPDGLSEVTIAEDVLDADGNAIYKAGDVIPLKFYYLPISRFYFPSPKEVGEAMAADLAKAGINVELSTEGDWATYLGSRRNGTLVGLYQLGWGGDNGDPDNFLGYFFSPGTEPIQREGWYQNPAVAELLQKALVTTGQDVRDPMYKEAEQMLHDDVARIWLFHQETPQIFSSAVSGYQPQAVDADNYNNVDIQQ